MQNYSSLNETHDPDEEGGVLFHVAEPARARWNHIDDLDSFFSRMYQYHQRHGYLCMVLQEILELIQFLFIIFLTTYVFYGINYPVLFRTDPKINVTQKVTLDMVMYSCGDTITHFTLLTWVALLIAMVVWLLKLVKGTYHLFNFWETKQFYNTALKIDDNELDNLTWHQVQNKVRLVQVEQQMCIHKRELTELDIYHRILRQQNYLVALVNKRLLPPRLDVPFIGEVVYWTTGLRLNFQLLFFWSPWAPFENPWHLREEYKKQNLRQELAYQFGKQIRWLALANFVLSPLIFFYQMLYAFFSYAAIIRKEPGVLAVRRWSLYGRLYLRHFNELEHELQARLTRAHRPATKYLAAFSSPVGTIISENIGFYATSLLAVLVGLSVIDEDVLTVEHLLTIMTALGVAVAILRAVAPDETTSSDLEDLLTKVMLHTHYLPSEWAGQAHTKRVRKEFEQIFQYGFVALIESLLSPILTPYILWFHIYPRSLEIVDFFRNFTVSVVGVGDVCSFAQMDVRKHGNPEWHETISNENHPDQYSQCEDGKVELSLCHFKATNPSWQPPPSVQEFVNNVQNHSSMIASLSNEEAPRHLDESIAPGGFRIGEEVAPDALTPVDLSVNMFRSRLSGSIPPDSRVMHLSRTWSNEGPDISSRRTMALNAHYLHSLHSAKTDHRPRTFAQETTPLLSSNR